MFFHSGTSNRQQSTCGCSYARTGPTDQMYKESQLILAVRWYFRLNWTRNDSLFQSMQVAFFPNMIIS